MDREKIQKIVYLLVALNLVLFLYLMFIVWKFLIPEMIANHPLPATTVDHTITEEIVTHLKEVTLLFDEEVIVDNLKIKLSLTRELALGNNNIELSIFDATFHAPAKIDRSIHFTEIHGYIYRDDLRGDIVHIHPENLSGFWQDSILVSNPGIHHLVLEFPHNGTFYKLKTTFDVDQSLREVFEGSVNVLAPLPEITFDTTVERTHYSVSMHTPSATVTQNEPATFTFSPFAQNNRFAFREAEESLANAHNFMLFHAGENFMWNVHGDGSVSNLTVPGGLVVERLPEEQTFYGYTVSFPKPGVWMLRFERSQAEAQFYIEVME